jgi:hypothetical protein
MTGAIVATSGVDEITGFGYLSSYSLRFADGMKVAALESYSRCCC